MSEQLWRRESDDAEHPWFLNDGVGRYWALSIESYYVGDQYSGFEPTGRFSVSGYYEPGNSMRSNTLHVGDTRESCERWVELWVESLGGTIRPPVTVDA